MGIQIVVVALAHGAPMDNATCGATSGLSMMQFTAQMERMETKHPRVPADSAEVPEPESDLLQVEVSREPTYYLDPPAAIAFHGRAKVIFAGRAPLQITPWLARALMVNFTCQAAAMRPASMSVVKAMLLASDTHKGNQM